MARWHRRKSFDNAPQPTVSEPRPVLLAHALTFVRAAIACPGVRRVALVGSMTTPKPIPKDIDLLVSVAESVDLPTLALAGRRLKGGCNSINLGADIFLCTEDHRYLGRICPHRECHFRASCEAFSCGVTQHLRDDLDQMTLKPDLIRNPPFVLWPEIRRSKTAPEDVEALLLRPLEAESKARPTGV